jgi:hypothetical protein
MDWNHQIERHQAALKRIVALLFALAELADRASVRSRRVRREVLFILSHGEAVARDFILGEAQASGTPNLYLPASVFHDSGSAGDALELATRLRALAAILAYFWAHLSSEMHRPRPRHFRLSKLLCSASVACQVLRVCRGVGFRALDSPCLDCG